ncbi:SCO6880 family protein [Nocardioides zeae]|uniref:SCO6880 family protein n=1 Tax=Nocardioides imazamoxiresistens TaxID=3231893 RepID=A0ABU3Q096_9ACTN|nr:SCO6880 family protein [Nocardioides zeae]MDT9594895.1 SCO6880 family protein [Nocardioides zeae]
MTSQEMGDVYGIGAARSRRGWLLGLTGAQAALVLIAAFPVWLAMALGQWAALLLLAPTWVAVAVLVCVPVRGWSAAQWLGVLARHAVGSALGWTRWTSRAAQGDLGRLAPSADSDAEETGDVDAVEDLEEADLPGILTGLQIHDGPPLAGTGHRPAIIQNHAERTWSVTARVHHPGIGMAEGADRWRMGAGLAELLEAASAGQQIHALAVQVRTVPDDGTERADWVRRHHRPIDAPDGEGSLSEQIHAQLDTVMAGAAMRQEAYVSVVVREDVLGAAVRRGTRGLAGRANVLYGLLAEVEARLVGAIGCSRVEWLVSTALAVAIRTGFEPGDAPALADAALHHAHDEWIPPGVPVAAAGPATASTALRSYRHGDWESVATTILLPRKGAVMGALARALVPTQMGERRALTVVYRPMSQKAATRRTGNNAMAATMGRTINDRLGRDERARDRHAVRHVLETDEKLERGRSLVQVHAALAITIPAHWNVHDYARRLDASVRLCGFTPLPLDGAHDAAFAVAAIPVGAGLPRGRH